MAELNAVNNLPRKITAVATLGDVGAAYAVYEKNWICEDCRHENYPRRERCFRCRAPKKAANDALISTSTGDKHKWREALDVATNKIYYYNIDTNKTQWERPAEMGAAPHSTGWFGRGKAGTENANKYAELNKKYLSRPARKQINELPTKNSQLEGALEYNIWYDKYIGDHWANDRSKEPATTLCDPESDAGKTKADIVSKANRYFCLHFARGMCARGSECNYYHRIPTIADETRIGMMYDCFGRERHATDRDDMTGVGNFNRNSRTLYVGGLRNVNDDSKRLEDVLYEKFTDWGEVENINVIHRLSICFVRYRYRTSAEFAKEAMGNQSLGNNEVLNIRWAYDDPNPVAKQAGARADHDAIIAMVEAKGISREEAAFNYPSHYQIPMTKRQKIESTVVSTYPQTDTQYCDPHKNPSFSAELSYADPTLLISEEPH
ncbi:unnamed protein product [Albugo candida]|uniref:Pre-mRNA-splicing factor cwc2 n=1 Tax=Albugo candida TaxID=65357 RepID=A0A024GJ17_9STRA|nr:unnamed protein product [Albugo candida]|eukprot:CCI46760.1 unnamed protein product [Albugo candida]